MSSTNLIKAPAWRGLKPALPRVVELPPAEIARLLAMVGLSGQLSGLAIGDGTAMHYRVQPAGAPDLFLKLVEPAQQENAQRAEAIAHWLAIRGVSVAAPLEGYPRPVGGGFLAVVNTFIEGGRVGANAADLAALGGCVAQLHLTLASHPDRNDWMRSTRAWLEELTDIRSALADGRLNAGPHPKELRKLAADVSLQMDPASLAATPLHGDLHPGNVLLESKSLRPVLLDFEDVFHSVLPPVFELLLILQRFVLVPVDRDEEAATLGRTLLNSYCKTLGDGLAFSSYSPSNLLRALALRSLCVLALGEKADIKMAEEEWEKFFELERQTRQRAGLIDSIVRDCAH